MKIILTGGGTAGHVTPHQAIIEELKNNFEEIEYIGSKKGIERKIAGEMDLKYHEITTTKFVRKKFWKNLTIPFLLAKGICEAKKILKRFSPNVVFSKGGFVSVPVVKAAYKLKIPVIAHESDFSIGLANRITSKYATTVCTTFEETAKNLKNGKWTGSPVRKALKIDAALAKQNLKLAGDEPVLTIMGGSQGAKAINEALLKALPELTKIYQVFHLTGKGNKTNFKGPNYHQLEFTSEMASVLSATNLAVTRGGSNSLFELAHLKKPMLIIPLPKGNSRGDQEQNAEYFKAHGYAHVLNQSELSSETLVKAVAKLEKEAKQLKVNLSKMPNTNAAEAIADEIKKTAKKVKV